MTEDIAITRWKNTNDALTDFRASVKTEAENDKSKDFLIASANVLKKNVDEFTNKLGIHLPEQGPIPKKARILGTVVSLVSDAFWTPMSVGWTETALHAPDPISKALFTTAAIIHIGMAGYSLKETFDVIMGRKFMPTFEAESIKV